MHESIPEEAAADGTPLVELFGDGARVRMLSAFVGDRDRDLTVSELARQAGVARSTVYDHLDDFLELGVVEFTRETGPSKRYQLNEDSDIAELLYKLDGTVLWTRLDRRDDVEYERDEVGDEWEGDGERGDVHDEWEGDERSDVDDQGDADLEGGVDGERGDERGA